MGEFGSNKDDNERKEKTSERAREREGGGDRGRALVRAGVEKEKGKKKERTLLLRERSFPPPSSLFSVSSFSSFRKKIREKYMQKTEREAFFESGARGRVEDEKAREREGRPRSRVEVEVFSARAVVAIAVVANDSTPMAFSFFFSPFFAS